MQIRRLLFLGLLLGAEASKLAIRQNTSGSNSPATTAEESEPTQADPTTAAEASPTEETTEEPADTTAAEPTTEAQPTDDSTTESSPTTTDSGDTTITRTVTVTDANAKTVSRQTTVMRTITSTVVVTSTAFETTTVTSSDAETATKTVYATTTVWANEKRALNLAPRTVGSYDEIVFEQPAPTITSVPESFNNEHYGLRAFRRGLEKRATITRLVTVTVGEDSDTTVVNTIARTVISTVSKETEVTKTITETEQAGAKTTVTTTGTLTITSTRVTTGVVQTVTVASSGDYGSAGTGVPESNNNNSSSSSGGDGGLSTGAKAGIGAGAGVAGLLILGALIWFCVKKRRSDKHKAEYDDVFGSSEVPVGGPVSGGTAPNMSQVTPTTASSTLAPSRNPTKGSTPEGYRGTALGDGRAGFAKPLPYGRAYQPASPETNYSRTTAGDNVGGVSPETNYSRVAGAEQGSPNFGAVEMHSPANTAELASDSAAARWHQNDAAEIDGNQVTSAHGSSPPANVYEMPAQPYK
ncbi:uncharacterized protein NECHADRAFT_104347 [Fusarium vanettenii 77-13-4]|uniref:Mid2 domain-containing protein n=1 Tax=Fusarium vanettenii (strain ATCC MYA-4622 / CBS 123669 / FGSC 9596 / NRRL 45880 / 77-13-4) TaxID=660122 RepID=C7Z109_FUSV7|nr:uncharacterized protein NECHADRAFT_104347 [Fusarium vanettenii 77-13-4]EEU42482.1 hypothetical protein NECHADRAFT_104347 [Fusarium vanettenii 77-13-4]